MKEQTMIREEGSADGARIMERSHCGSHRCKAWRYTNSLQGEVIPTAAARTVGALKEYRDVDSRSEQEVLKGRGSTQETGTTQV